MSVSRASIMDKSREGSYLLTVPSLMRKVENEWISMYVWT